MKRTHRRALIVLAAGLVTVAVGAPIVAGQARAGDGSTNQSAASEGTAAPCFRGRAAGRG